MNILKNVENKCWLKMKQLLKWKSGLSRNKQCLGKSGSRMREKRVKLV